MIRASKKEILQYEKEITKFWKKIESIVNEISKEYKQRK